jgi:hypothetical protein
MPLTLAHTYSLSTEDLLFADLDAHWIEDARGGWMMQVQGIHVCNDDHLVQIAATDDPTKSVVVRLTRNALAEDVFEALRRWSAIPMLQRPPMIDAKPAERPETPAAARGWTLITSGSDDLTSREAA